MTEAEWEYAARAGTTTRYSFGDTITKAQAQFSEGDWGSAKQTVEVGTFPANAYGLHDMHGNVWEWVEDCYKVGYAGAPTDGRSVPDVAGCSRAVRGGSWYFQPVVLRSAIRYWNSADNRDDFLGFRVSRSVVVSSQD